MSSPSQQNFPAQPQQAPQAPIYPNNGAVPPGQVPPQYVQPNGYPQPGYGQPYVQQGVPPQAPVYQPAPPPPPPASPVSPEKSSGVSLSACITTGVVSALVAFGASILFAHFVQQKPVQTKAPIAIVDMLQLATGIGKAKGLDATQAYQQAGEAISRLEAQGMIVMDTRSIIAAPSVYKLLPSQLVPGADDGGLVGGYDVPTLKEEVPNAKR